MRIDRRRMTVMAVAVVYGVLCSALSPPGAFTAPDSAAYLAMDPVVPLGYPAFLRLAGPDIAIRIQPLIFAASLCALGLEILALTSSTAFAVLVQVGIMAVPGLRDAHATILTESLFMSGVVAFLAAAFSFLQSPSWPRLAVAAAIVGVIATVRRVGWALIPVVFFVLLARREALGPRRVRIAGAAAVGVLAIVSAVDAVGTMAVHGDRRTSLTGRHLFAKAALLDGDAPARTGDELRLLRESLTTTFAPVRRLIAAAPGPVRPTLTLYYETCLQGPCVSSLLGSLPPQTEARRNALLTQAGWERIHASPLGYLRLTLTHYSLMWTPYHWREPQIAAALNLLVATQRPLPFEREAFKVGPHEPLVFTPAAGAAFLQATVALAGWVSGALVLWGAMAIVWRLPASATMLAAATAAAVAQASLIFSALAAAGLARFTISILPAVIVALGLAVYGWGTALFPRVARPPAARYH